MAQLGMAEPAVTRLLLALWSQRITTPRQLAAAAAISESQVAPIIAALQDRQCLIESTPERIALIQTGLPCWRNILEARRNPSLSRPGADSPTCALGSRTLVYQQTSSTNDICRQHAADPSAHGLVVLADEQTAGRGRRGNAWLARPGQSVLMSILLRDMPAANLDTLTLQLGLATACAIEQVTSLDASIKWPNDILLGDRKVAGVLVETYPGSAAELQHVVMGIGVNVAQASADFPLSIRSRAGSLYLATGEMFDRLRLIMTVLEKIEAICLASPPSLQWLAAWKSRCPVLGRTITAQTSDSIFTGQILDIDPLHGLVLLDQSNTRHFLSAHTTTLTPE